MLLPLVIALSAASAITFLYSGIIIKGLSRGSLVHHRFFLACMAFAFWNIGSLIQGMAVIGGSDYSTVLDMAQRLGHAAASLFSVLLLRFFIAYTDTQVRRWIQFLLWIPALLLIPASLGWNAIERTFPFDSWSLMMFLQGLALDSASLVLLYLWSKREGTRRARLQFLYILTAALVVEIVGWWLNSVFHRLGLPSPSPSIVVLWVIVVHFCMVRFRFLGITPEGVVVDVLNALDEFIVFVDSQGRIISMNEVAGLRTELGKKLPVESQRVFVDADRIQLEVQRLRSEKQHTGATLLTLSNGDGDPTMISTVSLVFDRYGDELGILLAGRFVDDFARITDEYGLTDRELDIVKYLVTGSSNHGIGEALFISENTVKRHVANIFNKTGVSNKLQLLFLFRSLGLYPISPDQPVRIS